MTKLKPQLVNVQVSPERLGRDRAMIEALLSADDVASFKDAGVKELQHATRLGADLLSQPGATVGGRGSGRIIGGNPNQPGGTDENQSDSDDFDDPLAARRSQQGHGALIGPPSMPGKDSLTSQDTSYGNGSDSSHGSVWPERHTERQSSDGTQTWGSTSYRDYSGNHWRVDYHDQRRADGSITSKDTVFDAQGEPIKTTVREGRADGTATETTTTHATGETQTREGDVGEIFPDRSMTGEEGRGDSVAPRGWHNPVTGTIQNPGLKADNNQVNPGRDNDAPPMATPLLIDPDILVINPDPDALQDPGRLRDIRKDDPTIIDPPKPL
jgi:hypothetical protein